MKRIQLEPVVTNRASQVEQVVEAGHGGGQAEHAVAAPVVSHGTLHGHHGYGKCDADADAGHYGYAAAPLAVSAPVCNSVPVKQCKNIPVHTPRRIAKTVCATHVDVTTIKDCKEVITTQCSQTSQKVATHSYVVGHDTKAEPSVVVAHAHVAPPAVAVAAPAVAVVGHGHGHSVAVVHRGCRDGRDVRAEPGYQLGDGQGGCLGSCVSVLSSILCCLVSQT